MVLIKGLGSGVGGTQRTGPSDEEVCGIIVTEVVMAIREGISELYGLVTTMLI